MIPLNTPFWAYKMPPFHYSAHRIISILVTFASKGKISSTFTTSERVSLSLQSRAGCQFD